MLIGGIPIELRILPKCSVIAPADKLKIELAQVELYLIMKAL